MTYDFRRGLLPTGAYAVDYPQLAGLPFAIATDHTEATVPSILESYLQIPGDGGPFRVPQAIASLAMAREWSLEISLSAGSGVSHSWTGTIKRGVVRVTDDDGTVDTGTELTTIDDAWGLRIVPPETEVVEYLSPVTDLNITGTAGATNFGSRFVYTHATDAIYFAIPDIWVVTIFFEAFVNDGEIGGVSASVNSGTSGTTTGGFEICGAAWPLTANGVESFSAEILPTAWLS